MSINFNSNIYAKKDILESIKAFKHIADFSIEFKKNFFKVNIININEDFKKNVDAEFSNYVLFLMHKTF